MRCFVHAIALSLSVSVASLIGTPTVNGADAGPSESAKVSGRLNNAPIAGSSAPGAAAERYRDLPLSFEANHGQTDGQVRFLSRGSGYSFFLTQSGAVLTFARDSQKDATILQMQLAGANRSARVHGLDELAGKSNYFFGKNAQQWRTAVPTYAKVAYDDVYPGINLVYYGNQRQMEYDFVIAAGADPQQIRLAISGAQSLTIDARGNLVLHSASGDVQLLAPRAYQQIRGKKRQVSGEWNLAANNIAGFRLGKYDRTEPLVIDPVLKYSSFLGGSQKNSLSKIAVDAAGNTYVAGYTTSGDFPAAPTPQAVTFGGGTASRGAFVAKIDPTGSIILYSTYLSGSADEEATGLAVDSAGNVYVAGTTHSADFPTRNAFQSTCATQPQTGGCSSAFLTKISPTGDSLLFSTYLGGSGGESARGLSVDASGAAYVLGVTSSPDFPVTPGAVQSKCAGPCQQNAFVAKFDPAGDSLAYATYLGGSGVDDAADIAVDALGNAYVAGHTTSTDFPLSTPFQKSCAMDVSSPVGACVTTAFVTKLKADGSALAYSTYLGGSLGSHASGIAVDSVGSAYVTGNTQSSDFPVQNAFQKSCGKTSGQCSLDGFVTKFPPTGKTLVYSTYLGGSGRDETTAIAVDAAGNAHVVGRTESPDFPVVASSQKQLKGSSDAFVARLSPAGTSLTFSTYHGGSAIESGNGIVIDAKGNVYVTGETSSPDFPTLHPFQSSCAGTCESAFVSKMSVPPPAGPPASISPTAGTPQSATIGSLFTTNLGATVLDGSSNPVAGVVVTFTAPSSGSSGTFSDSTTNVTTATTNASGVATAAAFTANSSAGAYTVQATVIGVSTPADFSLTNNPGPPASVSASAGSGQSAAEGTAFVTNIAATVKDASNNPVPGVTVTFAAPASGASGTFTGGVITKTATTNAAGVATAAVFTANSTLGAYTVKATVAGVATPADFNLTNTAGAPASIAPSAGTPQSSAAGTAFATNLAAIVKDSGSNPVAGVTVTFTAPSSGASGTFAGGGTTTTATTDSSGIATASVFTANCVLGTFNVSGAVSGVVTQATFVLTTTVGAPKLVSPSAGTPQTAVVTTAFATNLGATVTDCGNNPVPSITVTFSAPGSGASGTFSSTTTDTSTATTNASGVATASAFTANTVAGSYAISGTVTGATSATYQMMNNPGAPATVAPTAGTTPQTATVNTNFGTPLGALVTDQFGNHVLAGITVTFTAPASGPSGTFADSNTRSTSANTNASGVATPAAFKANTIASPTPYNVSAAATGATSANYSLTNVPGPPATITPGAGTTPQVIAVTNAFTNPLSGTVTDQFGNTVLAGIVVNFTPPGSGASGTFSGGATSATTNASGVFTAAAFTANNTAGGSYNVAAATQTGTATANFALTNSDFTFLAPATSTTYIQGSNTPLSPSTNATVTVASQFSYTGVATLACVAGSLPSGVTCPSFAPASATFSNGSPASVLSTVTVNTASSAPVGQYTISVVGTDVSNNPVSNFGSFTLNVECTYSLGNSTTASSTVPTFTPSAVSNGVSDPFAIFVTEVAGGTNCPWQSVNNTSNVAIVTGSTGQVSAVGTGTAVTYSVTPIPTAAAAPLFDNIQVNYFQAGGTNNVGTSTFNVTQEVPVLATVNAGVPGSATMTVSGSAAGNLNNQAGWTLTFALVQGLSSGAPSTVCSATALQNDGTYALDPAGLNYGISCAQPTAVSLNGSETTFALQISAPAGLKAMNGGRSDRGMPVFFYAFFLGLPAIVFLGTGTTAFGSKRRRLKMKRFTSVAGILLILTLVVLLPSCAGGFNANFGGNKATAFSLTVMGYSTDATNSVQGEEIFTLPLTIVK